MKKRSRTSGTTPASETTAASPTINTRMERDTMGELAGALQRLLWCPDSPRDRKFSHQFACASRAP